MSVSDTLTNKIFNIAIVSIVSILCIVSFNSELTFNVPMFLFLVGVLILNNITLLEIVFGLLLKSNVQVLVACVFLASLFFYLLTKGYNV